VDRGDISNLSLQNVQIEGNELVGGIAGNIKNGSRIQGAQVRGQIIVNNWRVGGLVGRSEYSTIENSYAEGRTSGYRKVGGLVGERRLGEIVNSYASVEVFGEHEIGGLIGYNIGMVSESYFTGQVIGNRRVGGLIGWNGRLKARITFCYATGDVNGIEKVGGLIGENQGNVSDSYATGDVNGTEKVGGLVGQLGDRFKVDFGWDEHIVEYPGNIESSYSVGMVSGDHNITVGGLVGQYVIGDVNNSFWDKESSSWWSSAGTGLNTDEMLKKDTFIDAGWDFEETWDMIEGETYPFLQWQEEDTYPRPEKGFPVWTIWLILIAAGIVMFLIHHIKKGEPELEDESTQKTIQIETEECPKCEENTFEVYDDGSGICESCGHTRKG